MCVCIYIYKILMNKTSYDEILHYEGMYEVVCLM